MKILLVTHYYPAHRGGVELVAGELAKRLSEKDDIEIAWAASDVDPIPAGYSSKISYLPMRAANLTEEILDIPYPLWGLGSLNKLRKAVKKADLVHMHEYLYMGNIAAFIFAGIYRKPVIITQHIGYIPYRNIILRTLLSGLNQTMGKCLIRHTNKAVFISEVVMSYFFGRNGLKNATLIPNGVDTNVFFPADEKKRFAIRQELGLSDTKPLFLFVGRFVEKKGLHILRELASQFSSVNWIFAGWGRDLDPENWKLSNVTVFHGRSGAQIAPLYQTTDLLVLPSKGEGFPLVIQEAMACGTPVLIGAETARACPAAMPLMLSEKVEVKDVAERWSAKIESLLRNPGRLSELRPAVAEFARLHWDWHKCVEGYYRVYKEAWSRA